MGFRSAVPYGNQSVHPSAQSTLLIQSKFNSLPLAQSGSKQSPLKCFSSLCSIFTLALWDCYHLNDVKFIDDIFIKQVLDRKKIIKTKGVFFSTQKNKHKHINLIKTLLKPKEIYFYTSFNDGMNFRNSLVYCRNSNGNFGTQKK